MPDLSTGLDFFRELMRIAKERKDAEFISLVADAQSSFLELRDENARLKDMLRERDAKIAQLTSAQGERCPSCGKATFLVKSSKPHPQFGTVGGLNRVYRCADAGCGYEETKLIAPGSS
jgi:hypothetical protein